MFKSCRECIYFTPTKEYTWGGSELGWCGKRNAKVKTNAVNHCQTFEQKQGCFLTTACVQYFGKDDNCFELTVLRNFRDSVMKKDENWTLLVKKYYDIAPKIVEKINTLENKKEIYTDIYHNIQEIIPLIQKNQNEAVVEKYSKMVSKYEKLLVN